MSALDRFLSLVMPGALPWLYGLFNLGLAVFLVWRVLDWRREVREIHSDLAALKADVGTNLAALWAEVRSIQSARASEVGKLAQIAEQGERTEQLLDRLVGLAVSGRDAVRGALAVVQAERALRELGWTVEPPAAVDRG